MVKETGSINKSLFTLGKVISMLSSDAKKLNAKYETTSSQIGSNPHKPCQDSECPYASSIGIVEDRNDLIEFLK